MRAKLRVLLVASGLLCGLVVFFWLVLPPWFWHPIATQVCRSAYRSPLAVRDCMSYNAWSGVLGSFLVSVPQWAIALAIYGRHMNCHVKGCWSLGHRHPGHGRPVCDEHFHVKPAYARRSSVR